MIKSLYVHIPFCENICDYCDFTKLQYFHNFAEQYIEALEVELKNKVTNLNLETIYVGGGTPTSLDDSQFEKLLEILQPYSNKVIEYTFEANPESLSLNKIKLLKKYGVNRVSIGVESTNDKILKSINRHHTFEDVKKCFSYLRENNINNINVDLILGLPNVTQKMIQYDIENILSLKPTHISTYSLTVHENTVFYINGITEPSEDFSRAMYDHVHKTLLNNGYAHYEISNFALPEYESKHNFTYWKNEEYYAVGLGASGYEGNVRYRNTRNLNKYLDKNFEREEEIVSIKDKKEYEIMLNLRTNIGLDLTKYQNSFNEDLLKKKKDIINNFIINDLLILKDNHLVATYEGMMILDKIILDLL